ncbi:ABC transporter permease [Aidingimonas halophila]|uniref:NitT/TauT family transport system permease protein n=1 Tax=Aidingimonas halophila TaxID=574349 RepID=A0A1H2Z907_9GAMM|nr:ABC transporter permease [Aidingimonas halophila]GHC15596.1 ABC transporter permease [Aidingimonas halophila]SDX13993.1 NitT/TauT family transport system permease protein [Aidingimonas halophila]
MTMPSWLVRTLSLLGLICLWALIAMWVDSTRLPPPQLVLASAWQHSISGELPYHLSITLGRVLISFLVAMALGTAIGIAMGRYRRLDIALDGALILGLNIPALVTIILCYIWFGLTDVAAITAVAINKIPTVVVTVREGARAVDTKLLAVAHAYRLSPMTTLLKVYLPQLYPYLMAAARGGLALIWKIVLVVELLGRSNGIGFQLHSYYQFFDITSILAYTLAFAGVILLIESLLMRPMERRLTRWRE